MYLQLYYKYSDTGTLPGNASQGELCPFYGITVDPDV